MRLLAELVLALRGRYATDTQKNWTQSQLCHGKTISESKELAILIHGGRLESRICRDIVLAQEVTRTVGYI